MDRTTVYTKTAKGITQVNQKSASLSKDLMKVLKVIDGKSNLGQIMEKVEMDKGPAESGDDFDFTAPGKIAPGATQRVVATSANDISELVRQQAAADAEKKSKE